jgi:ribose 5-phosphate isomerase B
MKIYLGADHRGYDLKEKIKTWLTESGHQVEDCGAHELILRDDYVDFAADVAGKIIIEHGSRGIVICGSGAGVNITANKIKGIRCCLGFNIEQVKAARNDDNINVLALASDFVFFEDAKVLVDTFLLTAYDPTDNHARRLEKIKNLENQT